MTESELEKLKADCERKKEEYRKIHEDYISARLEQDYGKYINKFTICRFYDDHFPIGSKYIFIKSISYSPRLAKHIIIRGIGFDEKSVINSSDTLYFSFDTKCSVDTFEEDVEIEIISEQDWRNKYSEYVSELNKYVNELKFV